MSHIRRGKVSFRDIGALEAAAADCGMVFMRDQKTFAWYGRFVNDSESGRQAARELGAAAFGKCVHALRRVDHKAGDYEVGVIQNPDGTYDLLFDEWGPGAWIEQAVGKDCAKLRQAYGAQVIERRGEARLSRLGFRAERERLPSGVLRVRMVRSSR